MRQHGLSALARGGTCGPEAHLLAQGYPSVPREEVPSPHGCQIEAAAALRRPLEVSLTMTLLRINCVSSSRHHRRGAQLAHGVIAAAEEAAEAKVAAATGACASAAALLPGLPFTRSAASELALTLNDMRT